MNLLIDASSLPVAEVVNICRFFKSTASYTIRSLTEKVTHFGPANAWTWPKTMSDVELAHAVLDSEYTIFICENFDFGCPDLVARALLSTRGRAITNDGGNGLVKHLMFNLKPFNDLAGKPSYLVNQIPPLNRGPGTGYFEERGILLVGEQPGNPESLGKRDAAFFSIAASSKFLRKKISQSGLSQEFFYWTNALDRAGKPTNLKFISKLQPKLVIALGKVAEQYLTAADIAYVAVPHPSYWQRFHSKEEYPLVAILKEFKKDDTHAN